MSADKKAKTQFFLFIVHSLLVDALQRIVLKQHCLLACWFLFVSANAQRIIHVLRKDARLYLCFVAQRFSVMAVLEDMMKHW